MGGWVGGWVVVGGWVDGWVGELTLSMSAASRSMNFSWAEEEEEEEEERSGEGGGEEGGGGGGGRRGHAKGLGHGPAHGLGLLVAGGDLVGGGWVGGLGRGERGGSNEVLDSYGWVGGWVGGWMNSYIGGWVGGVGGGWAGRTLRGRPRARWWWALKMEAARPWNVPAVR